MYFFNRSYHFFCFFFASFCNFFAMRCESAVYEMLKNGVNLHKCDLLLKIGVFEKKVVPLCSQTSHIFKHDRYIGLSRQNGCIFYSRM